MRGDTAQGTIDFVMEECCNCGMAFYTTKDFQQRRLKDHGTFYCPHGHGQSYRGKTEEQKLREKLAVAERDNKFYLQRVNEEREQKERVERSLKATRGHLTRAKNRLIEGNCPCCDAHFDDLETHIKVKHPDFELEPAQPEEPTVVRAKRGRPRKVIIEQKATASKILEKN